MHPGLWITRVGEIISLPGDLKAAWAGWVIKKPVCAPLRKLGVE
jgi:hypothetical protein